MRKSLWFCVPAHGRLELAAICMRQLRRTIDSLDDNGVRAAAVVISDDENLDTARELGFGVVERDNQFVSRRYNDGIQLACDPAFNPHPADYVVPLGSDDWVDWRIFRELPPTDRMIGFQRMAFVREDAREITVRFLNNHGGSGIRIYPRQVMVKLGYRPADEDRRRGCDTSILINLKLSASLRWIEHRDIDPLQIVDWKSPGENLNEYAEIVGKHRREYTSDDPFATLAGRYPAEALGEMQAHYGMVAA